MRPSWEFHSEPVDWILEDRCLAVIPNLGVIALTTGGFVLMIPFPGAMTTLAGTSPSFGANVAAGVSGTPFNIPFYVLGSGGISSSLPGNITGYPALAAGGPVTSSTESNPNTVEIGASPGLLLLWVYTGPKQQGGRDSHATRT
ncbi:MAG: hypothetical protein ACYC61_21005, partial [Isosphaeraceae bacterium]